MKLRKIYIAGKYTAPSAAEIAANTEAACAVGRQVRALGLVPIVPHVAVCPEEGLSWGQAMQECLAILGDCDGILLIPGWDRSRGALMEYDFAQQQQIPTFEDLVELERWKEEAA